MGCGNKISQTCKQTTYAVCVKYEGALSEHTSIEDECYNVQEVIEDVIEIVDGIKEDIDMSDLENDCIVFTEPKTPKSVIAQMMEKICELEEAKNEQADLIETMQAEIDDLQTNTCP